MTEGMKPLHLPMGQRAGNLFKNNHILHKEEKIYQQHFQQQKPIVKQKSPQLGVQLGLPLPKSKRLKM